MSTIETQVPSQTEVTEAELQAELYVQVQAIAERFFDDIDRPEGCKEDPIMLAYFMDEDNSGTHHTVKELLLEGVKGLCAHPDSKCSISEDTDFIENMRVILTSTVSGNQLVESRQGEPGSQFASVLWIRSPDQPLPY